ncbi:MAG: S41 family peptidase [Lentilitoribacter sp.]
MNPQIVSTVIVYFTLLNACFAANANNHYVEVADDIERILKLNLYNATALETEEYKSTLRALGSFAEQVKDDREFSSGFKTIWDGGPFSHVNLTIAHQPASELGAKFDSMRLGDDNVSLDWIENTAILTINSFMGADTKTALENAYNQIYKKRAEHLIVDLRGNVGGSLSMLTFVGHLIDGPIDAGVFLNRKWANDNQFPPTRTYVENIEPFRVQSLNALWLATETEPLIRLQFLPMKPNYGGPVTILTSNRTASASEVTSDALRGIGRAILIGEKTEGAMLLQKPFDVVGGFHLFLPVADYHSFHSGRIEGKGLEPDIEVPAHNALNFASRYKQHNKPASSQKIQD